jgi:hypothetical protein
MHGPSCKKKKTRNTYKILVIQRTENLHLVDLEKMVEYDYLFLGSKIACQITGFDISCAEAWKSATRQLTMPRDKDGTQLQYNCFIPQRRSRIHDYRETQSVK